MNNIIRSQLLICKKLKFIICSCLLLSFIYTFFIISVSDSVSEGISQSGFMSLVVFLILPATLVSYSFAQKIQIYEIITGFQPNNILLGKAVVYLPFAVTYLIGFTLICLRFDRSSEMIQRLVLYWILCIRATLCIIFLSPLLKEIAFLPIMSILLLSAYSSDMAGLSQSPISFLTFGQCILLGYENSDIFKIKVIASAIIAIALYYIIGYLTIKKKINLQPLSMLE